MADIADAEPYSAAELAAAETVLVATDAAGDPVGYAMVGLVDGHAHLEQLSVLPEHGGRGIGTALLDAVAAWATARGDAEVTLTTFRDVPFNAPLYANARLRRARRRGVDRWPSGTWWPRRPPTASTPRRAPSCVGRCPEASGHSVRSTVAGRRRASPNASGAMRTAMPASVTPATQASDAHPTTGRSTTWARSAITDHS